MADNNKPSKDLNPAYAKFADKMIELIDQLEDEKWQKSWANKKHILGAPENIRGTQYTGFNSTFLHLVHLIEKYKVPLYMTYNQARELGANIKQGSKAYPVIRMNPWYKDKEGNTVKTSVAEKMSEEERKEKGITMSFGYLSLYHVFNLDQTNLKEINEKKYNTLVDKFKPYVATEKDTEGMYANHELDRMIDKQEWDCPIESKIESNSAFYRASDDIIVVPTKAQFRLGKNPFVEGQRYYATLIHEMAHSTGAESRLNRDMSGMFGTKKYAKEELVAELTSGFITQKMGFDEKILINNAAYLKSWLGALREDPKEIIDAMYKVNKASEMITNAIQEQKEKMAQENNQADKTNQQVSVDVTIKDTEESKRETETAIAKEQTPQIDQELPLQFSSAILENFADYMKDKTFFVNDEPDILYHVTGVDNKDPAMIKLNINIFDKNTSEQVKVSEYAGSMAEGLIKGEEWIEYDTTNDKALGVIGENLFKSQNKEEGTEIEQSFQQDTNNVTAEEDLSEEDKIVTKEDLSEIYDKNIEVPTKISKEDFITLAAQDFTQSDVASLLKDFDNKVLEYDFYYENKDDKFKPLIDGEKILANHEAKVGDNLTKLRPSERGLSYYYQHGIFDKYPGIFNIQEDYLKGIGELLFAKDVQGNIKITDEQVNNYVKRHQYNPNEVLSSKELENIYNKYDLTLKPYIEQKDFIKLSEKKITADFFSDLLHENKKGLKEYLTSFAEHLNTDKKYELLSSDKLSLPDGTELFRIRALKDFGDVKAGDLGGYVEKEENLSHKGNAWIYDDAKVFDNAKIEDNAKVYEKSLVFEKALLGDEAKARDNSIIAGSAIISGKSQIAGNAKVVGNAKASDNATIEENALLYDNARISNFAKVYGNAIVSDTAGVTSGARIYGNAWINGHAFISGDSQVYGNARVYGNAEITDFAKVYGDAQIVGNAQILEKAEIAGKARVGSTVKGEGVLSKEILVTEGLTLQRDNDYKLAPVFFSPATLENFADYMKGKTFFVDDKPDILYHVTGVDNKDPAMIKFNMDVHDKNSGKVKKVSEYAGSMAEGLANGEKWIEYDIKNNKELGQITQNINETTDKLHNQNGNTLSDKQGAEQSPSKKEKKESQQNVSIQEDNNPNTDIANKVKSLMQSEGISKEEATKKVTATMTDKINEAAVKKQEVAKQAERQKNEAERISEDRKRKQREIAENARRSEEARQKSDNTDGTIMKLAITSTLLLAALESAKNNKGIWLNKAGKSNAEMANGRTPITPYNNLMMNLHSDKEGYRSNVYTFGKDAAVSGTPVRKNEEALPFNWVDWQYQNIETKENITKSAYNELDDTAKQSYAKHGVRTKLNVFNIDQTIMGMKAPDKYNSLLKDKGEQNEVLSDKYSHDPIKLERQIGREFPKTITLFHENNDMVRTYGSSATFMGKELNLPIEKVPHGKYTVKSVHFPSDRLEFAMSKILDAGRRVSMVDKIDSPELIKSLPEKNDVVMKAITMAHKTADAMGVKYDRVNVLQPTEYNEEKNEFIISNIEDKTVGNKREAAIDKANDIYRNMVAMTGSENRLDRMGRFGLLPEDEHKYEKLVQELSAGIFMARQGLPAKISKENQSLIPYWQRELTENPKKLAAIVERDVNNSVEIIDKTLAGKKINYEAIRNKLPFKQDFTNAKEYGVTEMLSKFPNTDSKEVVIIKDKKNNKADVLLPNGASLEMGNEISGIRKDRIITALRKEGINDVKFYNAGGEYALKEKNDYFADKNISLGRLKQYEFVENRPLEVQSKIAEAKNVEIEKFTHIKNDEGKYEFLVKANNEPSFSITPTAEHRQQYFASRKDPAATDSLLNMAKYYYNAAKSNPDMKHDIIMPKIPEGIDISKIERPTITKDEEGRKFVMATINDKFEKAPITDNQWYKMWLADDMQAYKTAIAAITFSPKLQKTMANDNTQSKNMLEEKNTDKKYELLSSDKLSLPDGTELFRIRALKDFSDVKAGDLGGYVEKEENLSHKGNAWIYDDAKVFENARVYGDARVLNIARVYDNAEISGKAWVCDEASVYGDAKVSERAHIFDSAQVGNNAQVYGEAQLFQKAQVLNDTKVYDRAVVSDHTFVINNAQISGTAQIYGNATISDNAVVSGNTLISDNAQIQGDVIITGETRLAENANISGKGILNVNDTITEEIKLSERANDNDLSETTEQDEVQEEKQTKVKGISR